MADQSNSPLPRDAFKALADILTGLDELETEIPKETSEGIPIRKRRTLAEETQSVVDRVKLIKDERMRIKEDVRQKELDKPFELGGAL